ncbi:MAG: hypothetical protein ACYC6Z_06910 [Thermoleophilia bacterium]
MNTAIRISGFRKKCEIASAPSWVATLFFGTLISRFSPYFKTVIIEVNGFDKKQKRTTKFIIMKKILISALLVIAGFLLMGSVALAVPASKSADVTLTYSINDDTGLVTLTAKTLKQGSACSDSWTGATNVSTALTYDGGSDYYVSTATLPLADLGPGTYTPTYDIAMTAGRSDVTWTGSASASFIVPSGGWPTKWTGPN